MPEDVFPACNCRRVVRRRHLKRDPAIRLVPGEFHVQSNDGEKSNQCGNGHYQPFQWTLHETPPCGCSVEKSVRNRLDAEGLACGCENKERGTMDSPPQNPIPENL